MAELSDVTRICGKEQAEEYLANSARPESVRIVSTQHTVYTSKIATRNPELVRQRAEDAKKAEIDGLLDELNDYRKLADTFGDEEYSEKVEQLKIRLSQIVEK